MCGMIDFFARLHVYVVQVDGVGVEDKIVELGNHDVVFHRREDCITGNATFGLQNLFDRLIGCISMDE